jgi:hypothetical protein
MQESRLGEGTFVVLTRDDAKELFRLDGDEAVWQFAEKLRISPQHLQDDLVLDCGTAWDPIHRVLTDGTLSHNAGEFPNDHCVLGGRRMHEGADFEVIMVRPDVVGLVAENLLKMRSADFIETYMSLDPEQYGQTPSQTDGDAIWSMFKLIRQLFEDASVEHAAVLFAVKR